MQHPESYVEDVLGVVESIPRGRVTTYGAVADAVNRFGPRRVGNVMAEHGAAVPWWRVVRADGSLPPSHLSKALPHYLEEGTPRRASGRIDMPEAFWQPPPLGARPPLAEQLGLQPHPEGGWYRQTWVSPVAVTLPDGRVRPTATLIYFFLPAGESSAWHRVASDEVWLAHTGAVHLQLGGSRAAPEPGEDVVVDGARPQARVPAGEWQRTLPSAHDALVSCLVSPGFDFDDFDLATSRS